MKRPDLSVAVVIPCFNAEPYLAQTLGSVLDQSHPADEIVIVDDGSTDESLTIARQFQAACPDVIKVHSERSGNAPRTRNIGAALTNTDALMFLDADDVLAPDTLESLAGALASNPRAIAACPWRRLELRDGKWLSRPASCAPRAADQDALSAWMTGWYYPPCSVLWSKEAFKLIGGWDEEAALNQDGDLIMRALVSGIPLLEIGCGTSYYRKLPHGQTSLSGKRHTYGGLKGRMAIIEKIARMLEEKSLLHPYRKDVSRAFALIADDAAAHYAGLCQQARNLSRHYCPSGWSRLKARNPLRQHSGGSSKPTAAPPRDQFEEIDFGINRAKTLLRSAPFPNDQMAPHAGPLRRPTVSVIIPVYNRAHLLKRTLGSVLAQTFTDFEVLVVDDCSLDSPEPVIAAYGDSRLRYLRQSKNKGVAAARNRGLREARAPYVAFLDDDDEWLPEKLALQVDLFHRSSEDVGLVYTGVETLSDDDNRWIHTPSARGNLYRELLVRNQLHGGSSAMIRRNIITTVGFFDETLSAIEDYDYWLRISRYYKIDCIDSPLVRYHDLRSATTERGTEARRSLNTQANLEAREQVYLKHGAQMRREKLAHLFLIKSARRHLTPESNDLNASRQLAVKAFLLAPTSWAARQMLFRVFVSENLRQLLGKGRKTLADTSARAKRWGKT